MLLLGALLGACASPGAAVREGEATEEEVASWEEGWEDARCVTVLCGEEACAFVRCRDVQGVGAGQVVPVRGSGPPVVVPAAPRGPRRWQAGVLWLPEDREPVFIIPWYGGHPRRHVLRDTEMLLKSGRWVQHHIFPQEQGLARWFRSRDIDIHQFTLVMPASVHKRLHGGGPSGGQWNQAWRDFQKEHYNDATAKDIWAHAFMLIRRFKLNPGPFEPYR